MVKKFDFKKDAGSLMIEALAMLALISMVTPILYKKAAERTSELQDINAASQMRVMIKAVDDYLRDNYQDIMAGRTVNNSCGVAAPNYGNFATQDDAHALVNIGHFCDYLPYGFIDKSGNVHGSYTFGDYKISVKKRAATDGKSSATLTGFILGTPKTAQSLPMLRSSRIASMIGSNGGYTQGNVGNGVQGVWKIDDVKNELGITPTISGSILAASMQPVTDGGSMNENVLYRKAYPGHPELNTMETTLNMGTHNINNINRLIVTAANAANSPQDINEALLIEKGGAKIAGVLDAAAGKFKVDTSGNTTMAGNASIGGNADITGNAIVTGNTDVNKNLKVEGTSNLKGDVHAYNNTLIDKNLTVGGATTLNQTLTVGGVTNLNSDLNIVGITNATGVINANGGLNTPLLNAKTLRGGLLQNDFSANPSADRYAFTAFHAPNPVNSVVQAGPNNEFVVKNGRVQAGVNSEVVVTNNAVTLGRNLPASVVQVGPSGELQVTDNRVVAGLQNELEVVPGIVRVGPTNAARELVVSAGQTLVDNGKFIVQTGNNSKNQIETADKRVDVLKDGAGSIFSVEDGNTGTKASVHVRKGIVDVASQYGTVSAAEAGEVGYIKADRFVDNKVMETVSSPSFTGTTGSKRYDVYQVNPGYTSVMHDIKLTTRGGARLSDILPDFINKGIYVVDNTWNESVPYWGSLTFSVVSGRLVANGTTSKECSEHSCWTSPWMGVIPAPQCPPGYAKVTTITPAGWAMGQAGVTGTATGTGKKGRQDILVPTEPKNPNDFPDGSSDKPLPLYFQKSTWLRANVYPHGSGATFKGWSAVMGFMYPYLYYKKYIDDLTTDNVIATNPGTASQKVYWNLFPVLRRQLEAYVTVYCYFDRTNTSYNDKFVDKYDQLNKYRDGSFTVNGAYRARLNDETLPYDEPW